MHEVVGGFSMVLLTAGEGGGNVAADRRFQSGRQQRHPRSLLPCSCHLWLTLETSLERMCVSTEDFLPALVKSTDVRTHYDDAMAGSTASLAPSAQASCSRRHYTTPRVTGFRPMFSCASICVCKANAFRRRMVVMLQARAVVWLASLYRCYIVCSNSTSAHMQLVQHL